MDGQEPRVRIVSMVAMASSTVARVSCEGTREPFVHPRSNGGSVVFAYAGWQVLAEYENGAVPTNPTRTFVYGSYIDEPLMMETGGQKYYYACNALYSVSALTDSAGTVVERYKYEPYGMVTVLNGDGIVKTTGFVGNPYTFTGQRLDGETGLMYYKNRYYDVQLGRFVGRDPIGYVPGVFNLYEYVKGKVFVFIDPFGLIPEGCDPNSKNQVIVKAASGDIDHIKKPYSIGLAGSTLKDLVQKIDSSYDLTCSCIKELRIQAHGSDLGINIRGRKPGEDWPAARPREVNLGLVSRNTAIRGHNVTDVGKYLANNLCFCKPCKIILLSCGVGINRDLLHKLALATGCTVSGPKALCTPNMDKPFNSELEDDGRWGEQGSEEWVHEEP